MSESIKYIGKYRIREQAHRHKEPYWASTVVFNGQRKTVVDAAGRENGQDVVRLLPYKEERECPQIDEILLDGDLLAYVQKPKTIELPSDIAHIDMKMLGPLGEVLKGRATHAELGYRNAAGEAMQVSLWARPGPMQAEDRRFFGHTDSDTINIYRVSLAGYNVASRKESLLKAEIKRWKELVKPVYFPCGEEMNIDPVDFTTVEDLRKLAEGFINHRPDDRIPPFKFKLNCVQWTTLVFSLAVCFPLSEKMLKKTGLWEGYKANWEATLGCAEEGLMGIEELPIPFYTMEEIVENTLDMYLPEHKSLLMSALSNLPLREMISKLGGMDSKRVMPNAFVIENRLRGLEFTRPTKSVFQYVATAVPEHELELIP